MTEMIELFVETGGVRLDRYIAEHCDLSRSHIQNLIKDEQILVDGRPIKASQIAVTGERIIIIVPPPIPIAMVAEDIPLHIVYEDDDLLVINKPAGLTVHPAPGHHTGTLVNAILGYCPDLAGIKGSVRPGIVHRLDKDTSGLMMVAKNDKAQMSLSDQIKKRTVEKWYLVLVSGHLFPKEGAVEAPIGRHPRDRKKMAVVSRGREARTFYRVREYLGDYSLLEVRIETGRTHQIRVHLSAIGYPVVGDVVYGRRSKIVARQFLHAYRLGFRLPGSLEWVEFKSELPSDLQEALRHI